MNGLHSTVPDRCFSVVIPVFNEVRTLAEVVHQVLQVPGLLEIIIVDDASTDGTERVCRQFARKFSLVRLLRHERNLGKTAALRTGIASTSGDIVVIQDADGEYHPEEIADLISPIISGHADVVFGSRFLVRKAARVLYFHHFLANRILTFLSNLATNINLSDVETGYKAFRGEIIRAMILTSSGFGFEIEVTAKVAKLGCAVYETPISYYGRTYEEGKKIGLADAFAALWFIVKYNLFCSLRESFHQMPESPALARNRVRANQR